jgi:hypothetical protein
MKTALQELMQWMEETEFMVNKGFIDKVHECLEKEKEQIIKSWGKGYSTGCVVGSNDYTNEDEEKDNGNYYYNQTYKK